MSAFEVPLVLLDAVEEHLNADRLGLGLGPGQLKDVSADYLLRRGKRIEYEWAEGLSLWAVREGGRPVALRSSSDADPVSRRTECARFPPHGPQVPWRRSRLTHLDWTHDD